MFITLPNSDPERNSVLSCTLLEFRDVGVVDFCLLESCFPLADTPVWDLLQIGYAQLQLGSISWGNEGVQSVLVQISVCGKRASGFWVLPAFCVVC